MKKTAVTIVDRAVGEHRGAFPFLLVKRKIEFPTSLLSIRGIGEVGRNRSH